MSSVPGVVVRVDRSGTEQAANDVRLDRIPAVRSTSAGPLTVRIVPGGKTVPAPWSTSTAAAADGGAAGVAQLAQESQVAAAALDQSAAAANASVEIVVVGRGVDRQVTAVDQDDVARLGLSWL